MEKDDPVKLDPNKGTAFFRETVMKAGCCGLREMLKMHAFKLHQYKKVTLWCLVSCMSLIQRCYVSGYIVADDHMSQPTRIARIIVVVPHHAYAEDQCWVNTQTPKRSHIGDAQLHSH